MKSRVLILAFVAASFLPMVVLAHHSFTATYDTAKTVTIEGKVTQFLLRNPHSFLHVTAIGKDGKEQNWNVEWAAAGQLGGAGVTRDSLKPNKSLATHEYAGKTPAERRAERLRANGLVEKK